MLSLDGKYVPAPLQGFYQLASSAYYYKESEATKKQQYRNNGKKRKAEDQSDGSMMDTDDEIMNAGLVLRPSSPVLKAMKIFASNISKAFASSQIATSTGVTA